MNTKNTELAISPDASAVALPDYGEQNASMMQQRATAQINAHYLMAMRNPRNVDQVLQDMLRECRRPSFCMPDPTKHGSSMAIYAVPRGTKKDDNGNWVPNLITGCTVRFAEMAARAWRNLGVEVVPLGEDRNQRIFQVNVTDFETNIPNSQVVVVPKTVERTSNKDNLPVLSQRTNSYGKTVFTLEATEEEISMNTQRLISKARRNLILQCLPGWLIEECVEQVKKTARAKDAEDPDAAKRRLFEAFATLGVRVEQITEYLGHNNPLSPAEMESLRGFYSALREGAITWKEIAEAKGEDTGSGLQEEIEKSFAALAELDGKHWTNAVIRNTKGKYVGRASELATYLHEQLAKHLQGQAKKEEV